MAAPVSPAPKAAAKVTADSGPIIAITHEPVSGVIASAPDARTQTGPVPRHSETDGAIEIAETGHIDDYVSPVDGSGAKQALTIGAALVVAAAGAFLAWRYILAAHGSTPSAPPPAAAAAVPAPSAAPVAPPDAAAPAITPAAAVERAKQLLRAQLAASTPRVQEVAAEALARTGDPDALAALATALGKEQSDIAKLDLAYALARGGDKRGTDALVAQLASSRRDVKLEAAQRLAWLGDKRAIDTLANYLDVSQLKLGAAERLAILAEPRALKVLDAERADATVTADDKARAAIALGVAGRTDVAPILHDLLEDTRFNPFAAAALASLHDASARPVLVGQLDIPSLRQLEPDLPAAPFLPKLLASLDGSKDTDQVQAAEAILLVAGPAAWSARE
jgi:HEAT repeat protein